MFQQTFVNNLQVNFIRNIVLIYTSYNSLLEIPSFIAFFNVPTNQGQLTLHILMNENNNKNVNRFKNLCLLHDTYVST